MESLLFLGTLILLAALLLRSLFAAPQLPPRIIYIQAIPEPEVPRGGCLSLFALLILLGLLASGLITVGA